MELPVGVVHPAVLYRLDKLAAADPKLFRPNNRSISTPTASAAASSNGATGRTIGVDREAKAVRPEDDLDVSADVCSGAQCGLALAMLADITVPMSACPAFPPRTSRNSEAASWAAHRRNTEVGLRNHFQGSTKKPCNPTDPGWPHGLTTGSGHVDNPQPSVPELLPHALK